MIYIIATRNNDRSKDLQKVLNNSHLEYKIIDGFIGSKITNPGFKYQKYAMGSILHPEPMVKGELGVMISHTMAITMAKANKEPYIMVFEDDARVSNNFRERLEEIKVKDDVDILMLGGILLRKEDNVGPMIGKYMRKVQHSQVYGMHAYIVFERAYDKVLDLLYSQGNTCDDLVLNNKELNVMMCDPWLAYQASGKSVIHPDWEVTHHINSKFLYRK